MDAEAEPAAATHLRDPDAELIAFLAGRSAPCPRCDYDLRDIKTARCPECGELLLLKVGSPKVRFGWLVLAMIPGSFSGIAALFLMIPIIITTRQPQPTGQGLPWPIIIADVFGFLSAGSVGLMYFFRHRLLTWPAQRQGVFAGSVWGVHILMFAVLALSLFYWY